MYVTYKNINKVFSLLRRSLPISCVGALRHKYYAILHSEGNEILQGVPISFQYSKFIELLNIAFHSINVDTTFTNFSLKKSNKEYTFVCSVIA